MRRDSEEDPRATAYVSGGPGNHFYGLASLRSLRASSDEQTRVSRRRFVASSALGVAGVATGIIGLTTDQPQPP